ncbi:MAG: ABC transporter permease [Rhizobiaceae bacterium]|nr:ABC transporter permease [Rhizobiaceae bacterium]
MNGTRLNWQAVLAAMVLVAGLPFLPLTTASGGAMTAIILLLAALAIAISCLAIGRSAMIWSLAVLPHLAVYLLIGTIGETGGGAGAAFYTVLAACWLMAWRLVTLLSGDGRHRGAGLFAGQVAVPALFGIWLLIIWEAVTRGAGIPFVLLPPPSAVGARILTSVPTLMADFRQTVLKAVLIGYVLGCGAGFLVAVLADRYRFLANGLLPIGNLVSALPLIGIAPIMVIWFGFDWHSKAAVVVVMTFFPMLVNTIEGLKTAGRMERDLMSTYNAGHWQTLLKLRLPAAMPFIFNALKINSTLALIGALVAEFFGTPIVGMGFRISTEVGRMNLDMVWAEIALAALVGSLFYGAIALLERATTFWHPSYRS